MRVKKTLVAQVIDKPGEDKNTKGMSIAVVKQSSLVLNPSFHVKRSEIGNLWLLHLKSLHCNIAMQRLVK